MSKARQAAIIFLFALTAAPVWGAEKSLGTFKAWEAYTFEEGNRTVCALWAEPAKSEGDYTKRGNIFAFVAHRTWTKPKRLHEISLQAGYPFKDGSEVNVTIDGKKEFSLFTDGDTAWSRSANEDAALVKAMRIGSTMVVVGFSSRGTKTTDTFALLGFTAAHNAANKACGVR